MWDECFPCEFVSPSSWAGREINKLILEATQAGIDPKRIEGIKQMFIDALVEARNVWRGQLIDLDRIFQDAWKPGT